MSKSTTQALADGDLDDTELEEREEALDEAERIATPPAPVPAKPATIEGPQAFRLQNTRDLRHRRQLFATAVEEAEADLESAEQRLRDHASELAERPQPRQPFSAISSASILTDERDSAQAELAAQSEALSLLDAEIAQFETPERQAAAAKARQQFGIRLKQHYTAIDKLEGLVKGELRDLLADVLESKKRAAAALGASTFGILGDMAGDAGLIKRLSSAMGFALRGLVDGEAVAFHAGNGVGDDRPWRERESQSLNVENLE